MASIQLTFSYADTDQTRMYELELADSLASSAKTKILAINESLRAGTDGGLSNFFISDYGDNFTRISEAKFIRTEEEYIDLSATGE